MPSNTQRDPADFAGPSDTVWDHARREYLAGMTQSGFKSGKPPPLDVDRRSTGQQQAEQDHRPFRHRRHRGR